MQDVQWKSGGKPHTLSSYRVSTDEYDRVLAYTTQHNLNFAELSRKAVLFFLQSEYDKGEFIYPTSVPHRPKHKNSRKRKEAKAS